MKKAIGIEPKNIDAAKVIYGTAKFGDPSYGLSNKRSPINHEQIIHKVLELGIKRIDTAQRYGNAESIIGSFSNILPDGFEVDTKIDNIRTTSSNLERDLYSTIEKSYRNLKYLPINTLYLHQNELSVISNAKLIDLLVRGKEQFGYSGIGASVYSLEEFKMCVNSEHISTIQVPINLLSRSFIKVIRQERIYNKEIVARSIFMQGLLAKPSIVSSLKNNDKLKKMIISADKICQTSNTTLGNEAKRFVDELATVKLIMGTTSLSNLSNSLNYSLNENYLTLNQQFTRLSDDMFSITNPRNW